MNASIARSWRFLVGCMLALALLPAARAGLITGSWDPQFGSFLPGMSWQVKAEIIVPNACSNLADGVYSTSGGPCNIPSTSSIGFLNVWVRMFDTGLADPGDFFGLSPNSVVFNPIGMSASAVRVENGQIVGFNSDSAFLQTFSCLSPCDAPGLFFSALASAEGNLFEFHFTVNGPSLTCKGCVSTFAQRYADYLELYPPERADVTSATTDLEQFLVTYTSNNTANAKYVDDSGNAVGSRLDNRGNVLGFSQSLSAPIGSTAILVPEPGMLLLVASALGGLALSRRPSARRAAPCG